MSFDESDYSFIRSLTTRVRLLCFSFSFHVAEIRIFQRVFNRKIVSALRTASSTNSSMIGSVVEHVNSGISDPQI